jgi:spore germination cell wall hydrolase CwlJ-like protein
MRIKNIGYWLSGSMSLACIVGLVYMGFNAQQLHANEVAIIQAQVLKQEMEFEYKTQHRCLALNIYHEARSDGDLGQQAVGFVTMNRVEHSSYPETICDVVYQSHLNSLGNPIINQCQFSWYCDGKSDVPKDEARMHTAELVAEHVMSLYKKIPDVTGGAIMYHAHYSNPYWAKAYERTVRIDSHIFYK